MARQERWRRGKQEAAQQQGVMVAEAADQGLAQLAESAGKRRSGKARKGNPALRTALCEAAWAASHGKDGYLVARYRRFQRRFGTKGEIKAIFAVAHTILVIIWHLLADGTTYDKLGADYFDRHNDTEARKRYLVRELERLGNTVTLEPAA